jgi:phage shock protein C
MNQRFLLNREQGKVMGVAAGLADWTGVDALVIRLGLVIATLITGPVMILLYILTGWLASDRSGSDGGQPVIPLQTRVRGSFCPRDRGRRMMRRLRSD